MFQLGGVVTQAMIVAIVGGGTAAARTPAQGLPPMHVKPIKQVSGRAELGLTVSVSSTDDDGVLLSATAGDLVFRKVVYADGRDHAQIEQGRDRIAFAGSAGRQVVTYGSRSLTLSADQDDQQPARVRALIVSSPALRQFRRLIAQLEATGDVSPEILGLRVTGAVVSEVDGDEGAVRRLSRELRTRFSASMKEVRLRASCYDSYQALVVQAAAQMEQCMGQFSVWNPMRQVCAGVWTLQVESAWFSFLSCSAIPLK
jgi:hypothetical protein